MGSWKINNDERNVQLFNSPIELGLRCLFILSQFASNPMSLDKLIYFDYFLIHAGDISKSQKSIHPRYPFRSTEIVVKREILTKSLKLLISKELATIEFETDGIKYKISPIGRKALDFFESEYSKEIRKMSLWIYETYKDYTEQMLSEIINDNIKNWGGEFSNESKFRNISL